MWREGGSGYRTEPQRKPSCKPETVQNPSQKPTRTETKRALLKKNRNLLLGCREPYTFLSEADDATLNLNRHSHYKSTAVEVTLGHVVEHVAGCAALAYTRLQFALPHIGEAWPRVPGLLFSVIQKARRALLAA